MFPFWDLAIWPVIRARQAQRVVEIGALRGETTLLMLDRLGPESELHVIDPLPEFDPSEHERKFPGRYLFSRDISHNVLPNLPPMDVALVDGDHNWFTVYHELRMLADVSFAAGEELPVLICHDVAWPYGRRDLYYEPSRIPEEFRQPFEQRGMRPARKALLPGGGMNAKLHNAVNEGGPRNGVMTAVDDFLAELGRPYRLVVLPIYFGLAIIAEQATLDRYPELARILDELESAAGKEQLLGLSESIRLEAAIFEQNVWNHREDQLQRAADRYLGLLGSALLNELYLEHEMRLRYLASCAQEQRVPERDRVRDPLLYLPRDSEALRNARRTGAHAGSEPSQSTLPYTDMGRVRLDALRACLETVRRERIAGDLVECGTGRGGGGIFMRGFLDAYDLSDRQVWVADTFTVTRPAGGRDLLDLWTDLANVRDGFARFGLLDERVRFLQGPYADTLDDAPIEQVACIRIGHGLAEQAGAVLDALYPKLSVGGVVIVDDADTETRAAVDAFRSRRSENAALERIDAFAISWQKSETETETETETENVTATPAADARPRRGRRRRSRAPLAPPVPTPSTAPGPSTDLSVIVVIYNMRREAARTLHSLSRAYQRGIEDLAYEVIVVENGSDASERLGEEYVRSFGTEFRYLDLGADASPTPVDALNRGLEIAAGHNLAFMIDGAHLLSPGVLRHAMAGLRTYAPTVVLTQQWYVGPGQQGDMLEAGYAEADEDRLFEAINWPDDGYRMFEISHFIGERDWFDGMWESNCIFVPRKLLEQSGAFDESFSEPGGGYANLEFYERIASTPGTSVTSILGEGSFHQVHGGTTTNETEADARRQRIVAYGAHYEELRGRPFNGPTKGYHYVGSMATPSARRTRARRMRARAFAKGRVSTGADGRPTTPSPVPEELRTAFVDAYWYSLAWEDTTWLGHDVDKSPADLLAYQEIVTQAQPDWIIETGTRSGGRARFFATICDLLGRGRVISIDPNARDDRPVHDRIVYLEGDPISPATIARVDELVAGGSALVVLGSLLGIFRTKQEFDAYQRFVPVGSYVVVEDTIVNGHPVWPGFGPGPLEAVQRILAVNGDFVADPTPERYSPTFNPGGFLKRIG